MAQLPTSYSGTAGPQSDTSTGEDAARPCKPACQVAGEVRILSGSLSWNSQSAHCQPSLNLLYRYCSAPGWSGCQHGPLLQLLTDINTLSRSRILTLFPSLPPSNTSPTPKASGEREIAHSPIHSPKNTALPHSAWHSPTRPTKSPHTY